MRCCFTVRYNSHRFTLMLQHNQTIRFNCVVCAECVCAFQFCCLLLLCNMRESKLCARKVSIENNIKTLCVHQRTHNNSYSASVCVCVANKDHCYKILFYTVVHLHSIFTQFDRMKIPYTYIFVCVRTRKKFRFPGYTAQHIHIICINVAYVLCICGMFIYIDYAKGWARQQQRAYKWN